MAINVNDFTCQSTLHDLYSFPCLPKELGANPLDTYCKNLKAGYVLAYNGESPKLLIHKFAKNKNNPSILVMCEREGRMCEREHFMPWVIIDIKFKKGIFVHFKLASHFEKYEADTTFESYIDKVIPF